MLLASRDIRGAFGDVPKTNLRNAQRANSMGSLRRDAIAGWRFRVSLTAPNGRFPSARGPASRRLPRDGVLTPPLWLLRFDFLRVEGLAGPNLSDIYYADNATRAPAHGGPGISALGVLAEKGNSLSDPKLPYPLIPPGSVFGHVCRRLSGHSDSKVTELAKNAPPPNGRIHEAE